MKKIILLFVVAIIILTPGILYFVVIDLSFDISLTTQHTYFVDGLISYAISFGVLFYLFYFWKGVSKLFPEWPRRIVDLEHILRIRSH